MHPTRGIAEQLLAALERGDPGRIAETLATDAILHVPGRTGLSGPYQGQDAILGFLRRLAQLSRGTFRFHGDRVLADGELAIVIGRVGWDRQAGRQTVPAILEVTIQREEVVRLRVFHDEQPAVDQLCS
jgi:ketosteroid isomerase-like protein